MTEKLSLVVLAAGMGSRYGGLKQVEPFGPAGETILEYSVYDAHRAGFDQVVCIIRPEMEADFRAGVLSRLPAEIQAACAFQAMDHLPAGFAVPAERVKPWGTGHAIWCARQAVSGPFAVINADDYYGPTGFRLLAEHLRGGGTDHALVTYALEKTLSQHGTVSRGICRTDKSGHLASLTEHTGIGYEEGCITGMGPGGETIFSGLEEVSLNLFGFRHTIFEYLQTGMEEFLRQHGDSATAEFFLPDLVGRMVEQGQARVRILNTPDPWFGVTYREDRAGAVHWLQTRTDRGTYPTPLWG